MGFGYVYGTDDRAKWPGPSIPITVQLTGPAAPLQDGSISFNQSVIRAMALWNQQIASAQFSWSVAPRTSAPRADNGTTISFEREMYGESLGEHTLAITIMRNSGSRMVEADIAFNSRLHWDSYFGSLNGQFSDEIHRVAVHELGHVLGLDHPNRAGQGVVAIMNSHVSDINRLQADDVAGARSLYGTPPNAPPLDRNGRLANISTRGRVGTGDHVMIAGFVVADAPKQLLIRALGPSLPLSDTLADPVLRLHDANGHVIAANNNWRDSQPQEIASAGIPPTHDLEGAILITLNPGAFTAIVSGNGATSGGALVEVYDLSPDAGRLTNISTRGHVGTEDNVMIGGFVINGPESKRVFVRGLGPSLRSSVPGALPDTTLELYNANGALLAASSGWPPESLHPLSPSHPGESAIFYELVPGSFTAILKSPSGAIGIGLIEVYDVTP